MIICCIFADRLYNFDRLICSICVDKVVYVDRLYVLIGCIC